MLDEAEQIGDFEPTAARPVGIFNAGCIDDVADGAIDGDHLPGGARRGEFALEPGNLIRPEQIIVGPIDAVGVRSIRPAIAAHVEQENVEQRAV
jgi:hypothetical protein